MIWYRNAEGHELNEDELERAHLEFLNDTYEEVDIAGLKYLVGDVLKEVDPIAYRLDFLDYLDAFEWEEI